MIEKDGRKAFTNGFAERTLDDIHALENTVADGRSVAAVARASEVQSQMYDTLVRPMIKSLVTVSGAKMSRTLHPLPHG